MFTTDLDTPIGYLRFLLGDDQNHTANPAVLGVLPSGDNLSDDQIQAIIDLSPNQVNQQMTSLIRIVMTRWVLMPDKVSLNSGTIVIDRSQRIDHWTALLNQYSELGGLGQSALGTTPILRADAYHTVATQSDSF